MARAVTMSPCPIARAVELVGDRWTLLILRNATYGVTRFDEFRAGLGIADNVLSNRLSRLVEAGLLTRVPYRTSGRAREEYRLTPAGADLTPVLGALAEWGSRHTSPDEPAEPMRFLHRECGRDLPSPGASCPHCDRPVGRADLLWLTPWRGSEPYPLAEPVVVDPSD
ncbi:MAG TPA: helix-turn-helix domain-containing protein [Pseudonocardia sp.]|jgi:DNA-binding HxlR family transcriptional regulator|nr:helix-turn-helix domain-containing protein [Pseudonocardia sp.]